MTSSISNKDDDYDAKPSTADDLTSSCLEMGSSDANKCNKEAGGSTVRTCVESSEEFTLSAELSAAGLTEDAVPILQLSGMSMVDDAPSQHTQQQQQLQQQQQSQPAASPNRLSPTAESKGVHFAEDVTYITEEDLVVLPKKGKKKKKQQEEDAENDVPVRPEEIWWTARELHDMEANAAYMVKECQQYQEEVVCTVLYNKAFLTAANLAKTIAEEELEERLQDIGLHAQNLESWTAVGQSRRGLENLVSEKGMLDAMQCRKAVLQFQQELREAEKGMAGDESSSSTPQPSMLSQHSEFLAQRYQDASRTSRIMARMMGQADRDSLTKADDQANSTHTLPEPPGAFDNYDYHRDSNDDDQHRVPRAARRGSRLLKPIKKAVGAVFRRQGSHEVHKRRIMRLQQKQMEAAAEPAKRPSQEFRRSFLENLEYGEQ